MLPRWAGSGGHIWASYRSSAEQLVLFSSLIYGRIYTKPFAMTYILINDTEWLKDVKSTGEHLELTALWQWAALPSACRPRAGEPRARATAESSLWEGKARSKQEVGPRSPSLLFHIQGKVLPMPSSRTPSTNVKKCQSQPLQDFWVSLEGQKLAAGHEVSG